MRKLPLMYLLFSLNIFAVMANNVEVENISIQGQNDVNDTKFIEFDVGWENSWRISSEPVNWDAVWVVAKYRLINSTVWSHASLSSSSGDHVAPAGATIDAVSDGIGVFLYRDSEGSGANDFNGVRLMWEYGTDGLNDNDSVEICVFAIEMVYVPQGGYTLGDGDGVTHSVNSFEIGTTNTFATIGTSMVNNIRSTSGDAAPMTTTGIGIDGDGGLDGNNDGDLSDPEDNPNFPTGYHSFYMMKYEITQQQYVEFVNKLTPTQGSARMEGSTIYGHNIAGSGNNWTSLMPHKACGLLNWMDLAAYSDWIGLRPMTELEFEKACRGNLTSVLHELAWGTTEYYTTPYVLSTYGTDMEEITNMGSSIGNANYTYTSPSITSLRGPMRSGIFAASSPNNTREETGGSYYGIMELSGNVQEMVVSLGDTDGRAYDGSHGNGELAASGNSDQSWPGNSGSEVTTADASGSRGGAWNGSYILMRTSNRQLVNTETSVRNTYTGGRCVRTAP